jgi:hypothetical protein
MQRNILVLTAVILVILAGISYFVYAKTVLSQSPNQILEQCNTLYFTKESSANLVFFSPEEDAKKYADYLFTIHPLDSYKDSFNVYYISSYKPQCELYKGIATLCYSKELLQKAASCPNDYIIVLDDKDSSVRSSSYINVMSLNKKHSLNVFPHEFGHSFANLAEEYVPANLPRGSKNCAASCDKFDVSDGCFEGCSKTELFRSIDLGIMRSLSSSKYGIFNEKLISDRIPVQNSFLTGKATSSETDCAAQKYLLVELRYQNSLELIDKGIETGCLGSNGYGDSAYKIYGLNNNLLLTDNFNPYIFTDAPSESGIEGEVFNTDKSVYLRIPIIKEMSKLEVVSNEQTALLDLQDIGRKPCKI